MLSRNTYFNCSLVGLLSGILIFNILEDIILSGIVSIFLGIILFFVFHTNRPLYKGLLVFLLSIGLSSLYAAYTMSYIDTRGELLDRYMGEYNSYTGIVTGLYKGGDFEDQYIVELQHIKDINISGKISHILRLPKNFSLYPGQEISYSGKMYKLEDFNGFAYHKYMLSKGIYFSTSANSVVDMSTSFPSGFSYKLYLLREKLLSTIANIFPENEAIFLGGILLGARESIPPDLKQDFNNSGLTHFIAVSGFNITLCIIFVTFLFGFLPSWGRILTVSTSIIIFSIFVGLGAPVVRAAIMGILGYIFIQSGQNTKNITLLLFTAVSMALYSPLSLSYDVSLHLSFLAVIGIMYTQDIFNNIFKWVPDTFAIREALVLTLSALSFSLPIMMFQFGQISLLAPLANIAVTWTIPLAMIGGVLTVIGDFIHPIVGKLLGFIEWILLHYDIIMVQFFGNIDLALLQVDFGVYSLYLEIFYFIILIYILVLYHLKNKKH